MNSISFWRKTRGKTQADIEAETGIDQAVLSEVESGLRSPDSYLDKLANALLVPQNVLLEPPPLIVGQEGDILIDRTAGRPTPGELGEDPKSKKRSTRKTIGRLFFLTPSQARIGVQRNRSVEITDGVWDGARVYVEVPCEPEHQAMLLAKAEAAALADRFLREEIAKIEGEYAALFQQGSEEFYGTQPSVFEDNGTVGEGLSGEDVASDRKI